MHFDARVCGFCRPLTLLCWHDVSEFFSYYRLFVDDLIDTLGLKLYIYVHIVCMYVHVLVQLDSAPQIPTMNTFSTQGKCSVTVSALDLLRILFHGDSISDDYGAR